MFALLYKLCNAWFRSQKAKQEYAQNPDGTTPVGALNGTIVEVSNKDEAERTKKYVEQFRTNVAAIGITLSILIAAGLWLSS